MAIYMWREAQPITTAWIYHNEELWLISLSSDGNTRRTIADKNLWATQVWNNWDALNENNIGKYYQWGNNYWFWHWTLTKSSTQVDASNYWPWNYYSSSTFITRNTNPYRWDTTDNWNLWGWVTWTNAAMQWPCSSGFHVPTYTEWSVIKTVWTTLWGWSGDWTNFWIALKLPFTGNRDSSTTNIYNQNLGMYWTSKRFDTSSAYYLYLSSSSIVPMGYAYRAEGLPVRPFKNEAVQPDDSRTVLYQPS